MLNNDIQNCNLYGRLYKWNAAKGACPAGWHLPTDYEWSQLEIYLGIDSTETTTNGFRGSIEGTKLKSKDNWEYNGNGYNSVGFNALPAGTYSFKGFEGGSTAWWTSTENNNIHACARVLDSREKGIARTDPYIKSAFSVRCIRE